MTLKTLLNNKLVKQTSVLAGGTIIAQIIGLLATPVLSRFYSPDDFGLLGILLTITGIIASIASLKFEMAIILTSNKAETNGVVSLSFLILASIVVLVTIIFCLFPNSLVLLGIDTVSLTTIILITLLILGYGLKNIFYQWHSKLENYSILSKNAIVQKLAIVILQLLLFILLSNSYGLVMGFTLGWLIALVILVYSLRNEISSLDFKLRDLKLLAKKYYRFPVFSAPQNLLNSLSQSLPILVLGYYFDATSIGLYFFTVRILQLPSSIIGNSIRQVFYKRASDLKNNLPRLRNEYFKTTLSLFGIILMPVVIIFIFGPEIFNFLFGQKWYEAGEFARWLFLWIGLLFVNPPSNALLLILNKNKYQLIIDVFLIFSRALALYYGGNSGDLLFTIKLYAFVGVIFNLIIIFYGIYFITNGNYNRRRFLPR